MESPSQNLGKLEDIFESSLNLEEIHFNEGFRDGYKDGFISGRQGGREAGLKLGLEVGEELGFYRGCLDVWKSIIRIQPTTAFSSRVQKNMKHMEELLGKYPILDTQDENLHEIMDALRSKFQAISATLSVRLEYDGYPKGSSNAEEMGF
ncbi:hypothetical protein ACLOJK_005658 [Asimina triloba]